MSLTDSIAFVKSTFDNNGYDIKMSDIENWTSDSKYIPFLLYNNSDIDVDVFYDLYDNVIRLCIFYDNWKLLLCMWRGYSSYDRSFADFYLIPEIVKHCSKNTVIASLLAMATFYTECESDFNPEDIVKFSKKNKNPGVSEFITTTYNKTPGFLSEECDDDEYENRKSYFIEQAKLADIYNEYLMAKPCKPTN